MCPSTKYRGKYPLNYFNENLHITYDFVYPEKSISAMCKFISMYISILLFRKKDSILVIQKVCTNRIYANALKLIIKLNPSKSLYDIDDAEYIRYPKATMDYFIKNCEHVSVGSTELYEYATRLNERVFIQTSPIVKHYSYKKNRNSILNIGWVGDLGNGNKASESFSHKTSMFKLFFPELLKIIIPIRLILIGVKNKSDIPEIIDYFKSSSNIEIEIPTDLYWENDSWVYEMITRFDIGVSPMVDHLFNRSKSAFKAKQYLSCGIPTIACDVGDNKLFVKHGHNGYIIDSHLSYSQAINKIAEMGDFEYSHLSENALLSKTNYSMKNYCQNILQHFIEY